MSLRNSRPRPPPTQKAVDVEPRVLVGASQHGWVTALSQWVSEHGGAQLVGQALTADDVLGADFDLLVVDGWSSLLSRRLVDLVQRNGAAVLVLVNSERPEAEGNRLRDLGVSLSLPLASSPEQIVARAAEVAAVTRFTEQRRPESPPPRSDGPASDHRLVVLLGDDGVTEVAVNLAAALARLGSSTVLVDLDTVEPSLAQRLGLPIIPNLLTASDDIRHGRFDPKSATGHPAGFSVIPGLANPREWDELTSVEAGELVGALREHFGSTLAVVHPILEGLAPLSGLEGRFDVGRRAVERADEVVIVGAGSPVGLVRTLNSIADVRGITEAPIHVAVNRIPPDRFLQAEWARELTRTFTPTSLGFLPFDRTVLKAAWDGRLPERGAFVREVRRFTDQLVGAWAA
jgi:MinD-like ATPase involved in chromosome partitioning or flagellar assembly